MTKRVWVAIEMAYDYHEFERFQCVGKTKEDVKKKAFSDMYPFVDDEVEHEEYAKQEMSHIYIFSTPCYGEEL